MSTVCAYFAPAAAPVFTSVCIEEPAGASEADTRVLTGVPVRGRSCTEGSAAEQKASFKLTTRCGAECSFDVPCDQVRRRWDPAGGEVK
jgi:hypothetical protein